MKFSIKEYNLLSNVDKPKDVPCYMTNPRYYTQKIITANSLIYGNMDMDINDVNINGKNIDMDIGGVNGKNINGKNINGKNNKAVYGGSHAMIYKSSNSKSKTGYNFIHAKQYLKIYCQYFSIPTAGYEIIKNMIKKSDNEVFNAIMKYIKEPAGINIEPALLHAKKYLFQQYKISNPSICEVNNVKTIAADFSDIYKISKAYDIIYINLPQINIDYEGNIISTLKNMLTDKYKMLIVANYECKTVNFTNLINLINLTCENVLNINPIIKYMYILNMKSHEIMMSKKNNPLNHYFLFVPV